jgi:hypothetical protein
MARTIIEVPDRSREATERLTSAFESGYQACCAEMEGGTHLPYASIARASEIESQEMRRAIDSCQDALAQLAECPEAEQTIIRQEVKATLEPLLEAADALLERLARMSSAVPSSAADSKPAATPVGTTTAQKTSVGTTAAQKKRARRS